MSNKLNEIKSGSDKTSILVNLTDGHGVLVSFLQEFHDAKINLTKLESRPAKKGTHFKYIFFIISQDIMSFLLCNLPCIEFEL